MPCWSSEGGTWGRKTQEGQTQCFPNSFLNVRKMNREREASRKGTAADRPERASCAPSRSWTAQQKCWGEAGPREGEQRGVLRKWAPPRCLLFWRREWADRGCHGAAGPGRGEGLEAPPWGMRRAGLCCSVATEVQHAGRGGAGRAGEGHCGAELEGAGGQGEAVRPIKWKGKGARDYAPSAVTDIRPLRACPRRPSSQC